MLNLDTDGLQESIENAQSILQNLPENHNLISLADNLSTLAASADLLDKAQHLQMTPEIEKTFQQAEKNLKDLEKCSDLI
jgi:hypothetical protein